jgi:hypothetical protein
VGHDQEGGPPVNIWIGGQENLQEGDVIKAWSKTELGGITLQVCRFDLETVKAVIERFVVENDLGGITEDSFVAIRREFGLDS